MALGRRVHEIRMILGSVAALCELAITGIVPHRLLVRAIVRSLAVVREDFSARRGQFFPMFLQAGQHCKIALIKYRTAIPVDIAGAGALLLFGSTVLRQGGT